MAIYQGGILVDCSTAVSLDQMLADADQLLTDFSLDYKQMAQEETSSPE